jgi:thiamine kinase-like enzyme
MDCRLKPGNDILSGMVTLPDNIPGVLARIPLFAGRPLADFAVERLGGLTNRNYKLTLGAESYVLRIAGEGTDRFIDRTAELHNARAAAVAGVAPDVLFCDPASGLLLTRFIAGGQALDAASIRTPARLRQAALTLKRLHRSGARFEGHKDPFAILDSYLRVIGDARYPIGDDIRAARHEADAMRPPLARQPATLVPSHIDPVPDNFVAAPAGQGSEALYLLDWEYSAMSHPLWDLADLSIEADFSAADDDLLLATYDSAASPERRVGLLLYKALLHLVGAVWALMQQAVGNRIADYPAIAADRLARYRALADSDEMRRVLRPG